MKNLKNDISLVMCVRNNLYYTQNTYNRIREIYPHVYLIISSSGSNDGTNEWLLSLNDDYLIINIIEHNVSLSENYNSAISLVNTEKLILLHNDMYLGNGFIELLNDHLTENMVLSYTTIEPPVFVHHRRPGKILYDFGYDFDSFNKELFNQYVEKQKNNIQFEHGSTFFLSIFKKTFNDVGGFDEKFFNPSFCEDDDFLIRAKIKGLKLLTISNSLVYHFVSKTSRKNNLTELYSNKNFIRKWGLPNYFFYMINFYEIENFYYEKTEKKLITNNTKVINLLEPYFDIIETENIPINYINNEQEYTHIDLHKKFNKNIRKYNFYIENDLNDNDIKDLNFFIYTMKNIKNGIYVINNIKIEIT